MPHPAAKLALRESRRRRTQLQAVGIPVKSGFMGSSQHSKALSVLTSDSMKSGLFPFPVNPNLISYLYAFLRKTITSSSFMSGMSSISSPYIVPYICRNLPLWNYSLVPKSNNIFSTIPQVEENLLVMLPHPRRRCSR